MSKVTVYRYQYTDTRRGEPAQARRMGTKAYIERVNGWFVEGSGIDVDASKVDAVGKTEIGFSPQ
jgi:hypothetical protein